MPRAWCSVVWLMHRICCQTCSVHHGLTAACHDQLSKGSCSHTPILSRHISPRGPGDNGLYPHPCCFDRGLLGRKTRTLRLPWTLKGSRLLEPWMCHALAAWMLPLELWCWRLRTRHHRARRLPSRQVSCHGGHPPSCLAVGRWPQPLLWYLGCLVGGSPCVAVHGHWAVSRQSQHSA